MSFFWIFGIALIAFLAVFFSISFVTYRIAFHSKRKREKDPYINLHCDILTPHQEETKRLIGELLLKEYEDVYISSRDGLKLHARYYETERGAPLQIQFHGYRSLSVRDFARGALECFSLGHNLLLVDQRAHGDSEGRVISFGVKERFDVLCWIDYALSRFGADTKIILCGISMGAATVILSSEIIKSTSVRGIIADCPYSSAEEIIRKSIREMHISDKIIYPILRFGAKLFGSFDPKDANVSSAAKRSAVPILLIHGESDRFVPKEMSEKIAEGAELVELHTFPDAKHGCSFLVDRERYVRLLKEFTERVLCDEN